MGYLPRVGRSLDCYFTLEMVAVGRHSDSYRSVAAKNGSLPTMLGDVTEHIERLYPKVRVQRRSKTSSVFRVIDKRLLDEPKYVMERRITGELRGDGDRFVIDLGRRLEDGLVCESVVSFGSIFRDNLGLKIHAGFQNARVIDVLLDNVELSECMSVMLAARTDLSAKKTVASYNSLSLQWMLEHGEKGNRQPAFNTGIDAFLSNPNDVRAAQEAMVFIESSLAQRSESGWNVRWAMRFLGLHQRQEAIPLLLRHLNYRYTPSHEVGTAYPAFQALSQMGDMAVKAALDSIERENDDLRLELRCRLALAIRGSEVGTNDLDKLNDRFGDAASRERWLKAVERAKQRFADSTLLENTK